MPKPHPGEFRDNVKISDYRTPQFCRSASRSPGVTMAEDPEAEEGGASLGEAWNFMRQEIARLQAENAKPSTAFTL